MPLGELQGAAEHREDGSNAMLSGAVGQVAGRARGDVARAAHADRAQRPHARQQRAACPRRQARQQRHQRGRILILRLPGLCRRPRVLAGLVLQGPFGGKSEQVFLAISALQQRQGCASAGGCGRIAVLQPPGLCRQLHVFARLVLRSSSGGIV